MIELGSSLHARTTAAADDIRSREQLVKYLLRPPLAQERLTLLPNDLVRLSLKRPFKDGTVAIDLDPLSLLVRLASAVPPPRTHQIKYAGVLGAASKLRARVVPPPPEPEPAAVAESRHGKLENPTVVATARWESPDGIAVYADFRGPVKNGTRRLSAEPALSQDEILALLLFGTPDGSFGAGQSGDGGKAGTAVAVGGGVATKGLNAGLARLTDMDVQTRIDTSGQSPRPELAVQLSRRVTAEVAYSLGEPAPGKPPDRTFFILDFRLGRRWSLSTTFGDRGSSLLDLVWRYRY